MELIWPAYIYRRIYVKIALSKNHIPNSLWPVLIVPIYGAEMKSAPREALPVYNVMYSGLDLLSKMPKKYGASMH